MKKEYKFNAGMNGTCKITIQNDKLTIDRIGLFSRLNFPFNGSKTILINQISGTQCNPSSFANPTGFLQFIIIGSQQSKTKFKKINFKELNSELNRIRKDENSVVWIGKKGNTYAQEIINYINNYNKSDNNPTITNDKYNNLKKLKELLDDGIIDKSEFETEKKKLLN